MTDCVRVTLGDWLCDDESDAVSEGVSDELVLTVMEAVRLCERVTLGVSEDVRVVVAVGLRVRDALLVGVGVADEDAVNERLEVALKLGVTDTLGDID